MKCSEVIAIVQRASGTCVAVSLEHIHDWEHPRFRTLAERALSRRDYTLIMSQQPAPTAAFVSPVHMQSRPRLSGGFIWV